jgi:hypothetical protein
MKNLIVAIFSVVLFGICNAQEKETVFPGADEKTPSRSQYFSWINNTNEGATEKQTLINLGFFEWLKNEYGMILDIYAFDAGAIDGSGFYGSIYSDRFKKQFPNGFDPMYEKGKRMGTRLGVWGGPDGFGDTKGEELERHNQMVKLCKEYEFALFKFDGVCGGLREEKADAFVSMMKECRKYSPDLILLNHRLKLYHGLPYATTKLMGGRETYIDVHYSNNQTAPHHRAGAISRRVVPGLNRLTEDHGVCISSCIDYWDDDLILQAFNRCLILAPEIYGNPWLLRDDEYPKLARIFNLHLKYRDILVDGVLLPEQYGPNAIARGDDRQRFITMRNISWNDTIYTIKLDNEIGLKKGRRVEVIQYHPTEKVIGYYKYGETVDISVPSFRSSLIFAGTVTNDEPAVIGTDFNVMQNVEGEPVVMELQGMPGTTANVNLKNYKKYKSATLGGKDVSNLLKGEMVSVSFPGTPLKDDFHRKIADLKISKVPENVEALYEATVFAADNNALEVRSIQRSGWSSIPEVRAAQNAFFNQTAFVNRGLWDKYLFDGDMETGFWQKGRGRLMGSHGCFRLDLGELIYIEQLKLKTPDYFGIEPYKIDENQRIYVSTDMINWRVINFLGDTTSVININDKVRYLKMSRFPRHMVEIEGYSNGEKLNRSKWRASNLFERTELMKPAQVWSETFTLNEIAKDSYLSIAINGKHGIEKAYAAVKIDGELTGCPDRAISYPSNTWENGGRSDSNYTYYLPLTKEMAGKKIEVFVMAYDKENVDLKPEVYISSNPIPFEKIKLTLAK